MTTSRIRLTAYAGPLLARVRCVVLLAVALSVTAGTACAHHQRPSHDPSGLPIRSLTHGQMAVMAEERGAILALAERQFPTDPTFRRLSNFISIEHAFCPWGAMPGSLRDETSPFNECAHAELAAVRALLTYMTRMSGQPDAALALVGHLDRTMLMRPDAAELCRFSDEPFNTADVVFPDWSAVPTHMPTLLVLTGLLTALGGALGLLVAALRRPDRAAGTAA